MNKISKAILFSVLFGAFLIAIGALFGHGSSIAYGLSLAKSFAKGSAPVELSSATEPPADSVHDHNYVMEDAGEYGYEPGLSQNDINDGTASKSLVMFRYLGQRKDGTYVVADGEPDDPFQITLSCKEPCKYIKKTVTNYGRTIHAPELMPRSTSIGTAVMDDAVAGYLKPYSTSKKHNSPEE